MGGHEFLKIAAATPLAKDRGCLGKNQDFGDMSAIGTQKVKQWHLSLPFFQCLRATGHSFVGIVIC
jgi:hypothetical protein